MAFVHVTLLERWVGWDDTSLVFQCKDKFRLKSKLTKLTKFLLTWTHVNKNPMPI